MAPIRLFGRGRNTAAAGGAALDAAQIAHVLEGLTAASMSTTWRCRHGSGVSIGEGAVDFAARRSRATVIRGKYVFEYVRDGASVLRAPVPDEEASTAASARPQPGADEPEDEPADEPGAAEDAEDAEDDGELDEPELGLDEEADARDDGADGTQAGEPDQDDGARREVQDAAAHAGPADASDAAQGASAPGARWQKFTEHDACGVHAYAEPSVLAAAVRAAGAVQPRGSEEFDGTALSAYAVTLKPKPGDPNRLLARLARQLRDHGANTLVLTAFVDESGDGGQDAGEPAAAGIASDGAAGARIVRLRIELPHWTPADDPTADHTVSVDLFEFGRSAAIEVPPAAGATRRAQRFCADLALF